MSVTKYYRKGDLIFKATGSINQFGDLVIDSADKRYIPKYSYYDSPTDVYNIINDELNDDIEDLKERKKLLLNLYLEY